VPATFSDPSVRRALLATTLVAAGLAMWPLGENKEALMPLINIFGEERLALVMALAFFGLPAAGMACLFGRTGFWFVVGISLIVILGL
jgi:hypothetical protein